jgi:hypothetical protein
LRTALYLLLLISPAYQVFGQEQVAVMEPNVVRWGTASEKDNFGYDVLRALSPEGPFSTVNPQPIPGAGTTDVPRRYEYHDESIEPDTIYWYYVESISMTGERRRITPIAPSKPKSAAEPQTD